MAKNKNTKSTEAAEHKPPKGAEHLSTWTDTAGRDVDYTVTAGWEVLRKTDKPAAEIFSVSYVTNKTPDRPVTFVFNGGPGASSAYLHVGTVGPRIVDFPADGSLPRMPAKLVDNEASWLGFTDLVFIDPVGTGFSRIIEAKDHGKDEAESAKTGEIQDPKEFFAINRDLNAVAEFMSRWLSTNGRWGSPVFIAGESYGGFRVAKLVRMLQETTGIGLNGAILISPALEFAPLTATDYDVLPWIDKLPTMAAAAVHHGRSRAFSADTPPDEVLSVAEEFATGDYVSFLTRGAALDSSDSARILTRLADLLGLPLDLVSRSEGRVSMHTFTRELLRDERKVLGLYDTTISTSDPYPDRDSFGGPEPTLAGFGAAYTGAINQLLRSEIGVETTREYTLLSFEIFNDWKVDSPVHVLSGAQGATDDFRYGMALNPHMKAYITHGRNDLITPYFTTDRLRNLMRLDPQMADRLTVRHFAGGHMFYSKQESRNEFRDSIAEFVAGAL